MLKIVVAWTRIAVLVVAAMVLSTVPAQADTQVTMGLSVDTTVVEGTSASGSTCVTLVVTLAEAAPRDIEVSFGTVNEGTATEGADYTPFTRVEAIHTGETGTSLNRCFIRQDADDEPDETIVFALTSPDPDTVINPTHATLTILDDDIQVVLSLTVDTTVTEGTSEAGNTCATITVSVNQPAPRDINITVDTTTDGTATEGTDYAGFTLPTTITTDEAGTTRTQCFIHQDSEDEPNETIIFRLNSPDPDVIINPTHATLTIVDDDELLPSITTVTSSQNPSTAGQEVTFTATVTGNGPTPTGTIQFRLDGVNHGDPVELSPAAQASFSAVISTPGTHAIVAEYSGDNENYAPSGFQLLQDVEPAPSVATTLALTPKTATVRTDTQQCETATVRDQLAQPMAGVTVRYAVTGAVSISGSATTNAAGQAVFCFASPLPGTANVTAYADANPADGVRNPGEPGDTATVTVTLPPSGPNCTQSSSGQMTADNGDRVAFQTAVVINGSGVSGAVQYVENGPVARFTINTTSVLAATCSADRRQGTVFATARVNNQTVTLRVDQVDNGSGQTDTFRIRLSNGYDSGQHTLTFGNVTIR